MADRVYFVANSPDDLFSGSVPQEMIDSLLIISKLTGPQVVQIGNSLQAFDGFLDNRHVEEIVRELISDTDMTNAVVDTLRNLRPATVEDTLLRLRKWREASLTHVEQFSDEAFASVQTALPILIRDYPALVRHRKALRLASFTGKQLRNIDFVCDARPVFDSDRREIEGFLAQTTMRVVCENQVEEGDSSEIMLSPKQLEQLIDKAKKALEKIESMTTLIEQWMPGRMATSLET